MSKIKELGLNFNSLDTKEETEMYKSLVETETQNIGVSKVQEQMSDFNYNENLTYPVCILSHMYDAKRSKFLVQLQKEAELKGLDRDYIIFTYADQKELYKQFENIDGIQVHYISLNNPEYLTLSGKRQYILEYNQENETEHAFFIEDDCFDFVLPIGAIGEAGSFRNKRFNMSFSLTFSFWEHLIKRNNLQYSGPVNNMEFAFRDLSKNPFIKHL